MARHRTEGRWQKGQAEWSENTLDLAAEARRCCESLEAGGGYILGSAHLFQADVTPENVLVAYRD